MNDILEKLNITDKAEEIRILKEIIVHTFTWGDLNPKYKDAGQVRANTFCMFHENTNSPAGRFYVDDERDITIFHCFTEHKNFTTYDYVNILLCDRQRKYIDPWDFLLKELGPRQTIELATLAKDKVQITEESLLEKKVEYITNTYNKYDNVVDFINSLYTEAD